MRAVDIALLLITLQATVGFVNTIGIFPNSDFPTMNNSYTSKSISDISTDGQMNPSMYDKATTLLDMGVNAIFFMATILLSVVMIFPTLITEFGIPTALSALIQVIIWFVYLLGYTQWKSGKSTGQFQ